MCFLKMKAKLLHKENIMAKKNLWLGILAMVLVFGIWFTACDSNGGGKYDPIVYTGNDASGNTYKLEITKNTGKAAFTPASGDPYTMTVTYANGTTKTSTGTIGSYSSTNSGTTITLVSNNTTTFVGATSLTITITSSGTITKIEGTIPFNDNTTAAAPGTLSPQGNNPGGTEPTPPSGGGNQPTSPGSGGTEPTSPPGGGSEPAGSNPIAHTIYEPSSSDPRFFGFDTDTWVYCNGESTPYGHQAIMGGPYTVYDDSMDYYEIHLNITYNDGVTHFAGFTNFDWKNDWKYGFYLQFYPPSFDYFTFDGEYYYKAN